MGVLGDAIRKIVDSKEAEIEAQRRRVEQLETALLKWINAPCPCGCAACMELLDDTDGLPESATAPR